MAKQDCKYKQTSSYFKLIGIINGKDKPAKNYGFQQGKSKQGTDFRSIRFRVKTAENNNVSVELYGQVQEYAYFYNRDKKETIKIKWAQRHTFQQTGYELITPAYDLAQQIQDSFSDGDSVVIIGKIDHGQYTDSSDRVKHTTRFTIGQVYPCSEPLDFQAKDFEEVSIFEEQIVINCIEEVEETMLVSAYVVKYNDIFQPCTFIMRKENCTQTFLDNMCKLSYGTLITVSGLVNSRAIAEPPTEEETEDDGWGRKVRKTFSQQQRDLEIIGADGGSIVEDAYEESTILAAIREQQQRQQEKDAAFNPQKVKTAPASFAQEQGKEAVDVEQLPFDLD